MRTIRAIVREIPVWRRGGRAVEGPDEDAFTLAVAALESLADRPVVAGAPLARVHVVGALAPDAPGAIGEAMGDPSLEVRSAVGGAAELYAALSAATLAGAHGPEAVVAVDRAGADGSYGAGAVAFAISEGPGLGVGPHGERRHPPEHRPDASAWTAAVARGFGGAAPSSGVLYVRAEAPAPVLLNVWARANPGVPVEMAPPHDPILGPAPHLGAALDLAAVARADRFGPTRLVATIAGGRTVFGGFRSEGPVDAPDPPVPPTGPSWAGRSASEETALLGRVAEGAYVPRPRYLEGRPSHWRFVAERCGACQTLTFPARGACRSCGRADRLTPEPLPRDGGVVESRTTVRPGAQPTEFDPWVDAVGPYDVVIVRWSTGVRATLSVTDAPVGTIPLGARIRTRLRRLYPTEGEWRYGRKAVPLDPGAAANVPPAD